MAVVTQSMACPICGASTRVPKTLPSVDGEPRRIRECTGPLKHKFETREVFVRDVPNRSKWIRDRSGRRKKNFTLAEEKQIFEDVGQLLAEALHEPAGERVSGGGESGSEA